MHESLKLFDEICNSKWFSSVPIVLFLNKKDLFEEKIKKVNISVAFPDYDGPQAFKEASEYIQDQFIALNGTTCIDLDVSFFFLFLNEGFIAENPAKSIFPHVTQATDTKNIQTVFDSVRSIVIGKAIAGMQEL